MLLILNFAILQFNGIIKLKKSLMRNKSGGKITIRLTIHV